MASTPSHLKALQLNPRIVRAWMRLSRSFEAGKEPAQALECCESALVLAPENAALYRNKGRLLEVLGKYELAEPAYERAVRLEPDNAEGRVGWGRMLARSGRPHLAEIQYERALEIEPDNMKIRELIKNPNYV